MLRIINVKWGKKKGEEGIEKIFLNVMISSLEKKTGHQFNELSPPAFSSDLINGTRVKRDEIAISREFLFVWCVYPAKFIGE